MDSSEAHRAALKALTEEVDALRVGAAARDRAEAAVERLRKRCEAFGETKEALGKCEALALDLPNITRFVVHELALKLDAPERPAPFVRFVRGARHLSHL